MICVDSVGRVAGSIPVATHLFLSFLMSFWDLSFPFLWFFWGIVR